MLWMRPKRMGSAKRVPYHLPMYENTVNQDTHYYHTMCINEVKGLYGQWEIIEDPPENECCTKCVSMFKKGVRPR